MEDIRGLCQKCCRVDLRRQDVRCVPGASPGGGPWRRRRSAPAGTNARLGAMSTKLPTLGRRRLLLYGLAGVATVGAGVYFARRGYHVYDVIVIGAGSAGSVLTGNLAAA